MPFICPVCKMPFTETDSAYRCAQNHCFDKAKEGYVNLLMSQKSSKKRHGDDKMMIRARNAFLSKGYYDFLLDQIFMLIQKHTATSSELCILDAGCGECYYSSALRQRLEAEKKRTQIFGIDISKNAVAIAAKINPDIHLAVAGVNHLPISDQSVDIVLTLFSPFCEEEFARVLRPGGIVIHVFPLKNHLLELKSAIYDKVYLNHSSLPPLLSLRESEFVTIEKSLHIHSATDIENLFKMTPDYYKTSLEDQAKLTSLQSLSVQAEFGISVLKK